MDGNMILLGFLTLLPLALIGLGELTRPTHGRNPITNEIVRLPYSPLDHAMVKPLGWVAGISFLGLVAYMLVTGHGLSQ